MKSNISSTIPLKQFKANPMMPENRRKCRIHNPNIKQNKENESTFNSPPTNPSVCQNGLDDQDLNRSKTSTSTHFSPSIVRKEKPLRVRPLKCPD